MPSSITHAALQNQNYYEEAIKDYDKALALNPQVC